MLESREGLGWNLWIVSELEVLPSVGRPQELNAPSLIEWKRKGTVSHSLQLGPGPSLGGGN